MMTPSELVTSEISYHGLIFWMQYLFSFMYQVFAHLFQTNTAEWHWTENEKQYELYANAVPNMTEKGADIVGAIMTILHNGLVFAAQLSTLLPYNVVPINIPT